MFKRCVSVAFLVAAAPTAAFAGAWTLPEGTGQWLAMLTAATSTSYFDGSGLASTPGLSLSGCSLD